ncbi:hypothetical protein EV182_004317, partial [Spiromyces aspiralis]
MSANSSLLSCLAECLGIASTSAAGGRTAPPLDPEYVSKLPLDQFIYQTLNSAPSVIADQHLYEQMFTQLLAHSSSDGGGDSGQQVAGMVHGNLTEGGLLASNVDKATAAWATWAAVAALNGSGGKANSTQATVMQSPSSQAGRPDIYVRSFFFPSEESFNPADTDTVNCIMYTGAMQQLVRALESARESIDLAIYSFTDNDLSKVIKNAFCSGVRVRIMSEDDQLGKPGNDIAHLRDDVGIPVKLDNSPSLMHNKFCIVDRRFVITGSYNWSKS